MMGKITKWKIGDVQYLGIPGMVIKVKDGHVWMKTHPDEGWVYYPKLSAGGSAYNN